MRDDIIKHFKLAVLIEFDSEAADWMETNWMHINEHSHRLCKGFGQRCIKPELEEPSLVVHLAVAVESPKRFANLTSLHIRYKNIYELFKERAYQKTEAVLSEEEYNSYIRNVTTDDNDDLFEEHAEEFRVTPLRDWIEKIQQFKTAASIKDTASV